ncbi:hypothetical protein LAZ67_9003217, partial [Cordylochernes scorpioides]
MISGIEPNPGPKKQTTLFTEPTPTVKESPDTELKTMIVQMSSEIRNLGERLDTRLSNNEKRIIEWDQRLLGVEMKLTTCVETMAATNEIVSENVIKLREIEARTDFLEMKLREPNLVFYGVEGEANEAPAESLQKVKSIIKEKMQILENINITKFYRLGKANKSPILISIPEYEERIKLFKNTIKLRDIHIVQAMIIMVDRSRQLLFMDRDGVTLKHCSMAYWLKVITALLIIGCIELNPGPKRQATLTNIPHSTPEQAPMDDLKLLIINLSAEVNRLGEKMDARLLNIEQKMEVWERRMTGIETSMASCTDALATNTRLISHNTLKIKNLEERAEALERRARENNLIIYGIESAETDSRELLLQKVNKLMAEDMQITDDVVIAECHRLGRGPKAPILIEVPDHESRISLLKNSFKLRMLNIFMSRDYSPQIREQRKILIEKRKELYKK